MILRTVQLKGCRCFRNLTPPVGEFSDGLNLIVGPNESGKSTLVEAVARALFDRYSSGAQVIKDLRPWGTGTDIDPEVTLEFECGEGKYRLWKRLCGHADAQLDEWDGTAYQLRRQKESVDDFLRELLLAETPQNQGSKPEKWGLARTLWLLQRCRGEAWAVSDPIRDRLQEALGASPAAPGRSLLGDRIERLYRESFTETGRLAQGAKLSRAQEELEALQADLADLTARHEQAQEYERQLDERHGLESQLAQEAGDLTQRREELSKAAQAVAAQRGELEKLEKEEKIAQQEHQRLAQARERYTKAQENQVRQQEELDQLESQVHEAEVAHKSSTRLRDEAEANGALARKAATEARQAYDHCLEVNKARRLAEQERQLAQLIDRLDNLSEIEAQRRREYEALAWPQLADEELARTLETDLKIAQAQLQNSGLNVHVQLLRDQALQLSGDESEEASVEGHAGDPVDYQAGRRVSLTFPDVATVEVTTGAEETARLAESMQETRTKLQDLLSLYGVAEASALAERVKQGQALQNELSSLRKEIKQAAGEFADLSEARVRKAQLTAELNASLARLGEDRETLAGLAAAPEDDLAEQFRRADQALTDAEAAAARRRAELEEAIKAEQELGSRRGAIQADVRSSETEKTTIVKGVDCTTSGELDERLTAAEAEVTKRQKRVQELGAQLPDEMTDPERLLRTTQEGLDQIDKQRRGLRDQVVELETKLDASRQGDLFASLQRTREQVEAKQRDLQDLLRGTWAIELLRTLYRQRHAGGERLWQSVEEKMGRMIRAISQRPCRQVRLKNDLGCPEFCDLQSPADDSWIAGDELSSGAQEQMELVYRLALGEVYAEKFGRQMLVLDDVLVYTDPDRYSRILEILKIGAERLQIFILTSHPQFYRGVVPGEFVFDLPTLTAAT